MKRIVMINRKTVRCCDNLIIIKPTQLGFVSCPSCGTTYSKNGKQQLTFENGRIVLKAN